MHTEPAVTPGREFFNDLVVNFSFGLQPRLGVAGTLERKISSSSLGSVLGRQWKAPLGLKRPSAITPRA